MRALIIDNKDSFTFNIYQLVTGIADFEATVISNSAAEFEAVDLNYYDNIIISPGPGHPRVPADFGVCRDVIARSRLPILGVCLGHQGIAHHFGGDVRRANCPMHGRVSQVWHSGVDIFRRIPSPFNAVRYHSLIASPALPSCLEVTAWTRDGEVMSLRHRSLPLWGVQFHPESIRSEYGAEIVRNFFELSREIGMNGGRRSQPAQGEAELTLASA